MRTRTSATIAAILLAGSGVSASAHLGATTGSALAGGFAHPFGGVDHIAAALAVGLWAAMVGARARLWWPAAFVAMMCAGATIGAAGYSLPGVEAAILVSVIGLGAVIAFGAAPPLAAGSAVCALFALAHGLAHGAEMPAGASSMSYVAGLGLATTLLHGIGLALGRASLGPAARRLAGVAIAAAGVAQAVV